jgi:hypothetical protein
MPDLTPIPRPARYKFRDFRLYLVPPLVFLSAVAGIVVTWKNFVPTPTLVQKTEPPVAPVPVAPEQVLAKARVNPANPEEAIRTP